MLEYLMLGNVRAWKYSKTGARARSILEKFAFDTTLELSIQIFFFSLVDLDGGWTVVSNQIPMA